MGRPYRIGTIVRVGKTQKGVIRDYITYKNGTRDYKILVKGRGIKMISAKRIRRLRKR